LENLLVNLGNVVWIVPAVFGGFTVILLLIWMWLSFGPAPRVRAVEAPEAAPPPPPKSTTQPLPLITDDTVIDRAASSGPASITVESGLPGVTTLNLPGDNFRIGRFHNPEMDVLLPLDEKSVSRNHALFNRDPNTGMCTLQDLGSRYGTFIVNAGGGLDQLAQGQSYPLMNGAVVQFGSAVRVRFNLPGSAAPSSGSADPYTTQI
jgi:pSer/pThr/pTyr-binding forkhead associated (FHA) protein